MTALDTTLTSTPLTPAATETKLRIQPVILAGRDAILGKTRGQTFQDGGN